MKIAQSNVTMSASRQYMQTDRSGGVKILSDGSFQGVTDQREEMNGNGTGGNRRVAYAKESLHFEKVEIRNGIPQLVEDLVTAQKDKTAGTVGTEQAASADTAEVTELPNIYQIQYDLIMQMIHRMGWGGKYQQEMSYAEWDRAGFSMQEMTYTGWEQTGFSVQEMTYAEQEQTSFGAQGMALTEDGRTIDFHVNILMSRDYAEYTQTTVPFMLQTFMDPLVINVDAGVTELSDQTFFFDLDGDGRKEEISALGRGSGFLALDLNGDGMINDGTELFGTKSGDGFGDLRKYDRDGNGWIDENDEIFDKLKVWFKGADGKDVLMDLKKADVGAIYLGEQVTEFSLYGNLGRENGRVKSTGVFLKENGGAGTVQHVDLAVHFREGEGTDTVYHTNSDRQAGHTSEKRTYRHYQWNRFKQSYNLV